MGYAEVSLINRRAKFFVTPCCVPPAMMEWLEDTELDILVDVPKDGPFIEL